MSFQKKKTHNCKFKSKPKKGKTKIMLKAKENLFQVKNNKLKKLQSNLQSVLQVIDVVENLTTSKRKWWVHPINENRAEQGDFENLIEEIKSYDPEKFFSYTRMSVGQFNYLLDLVKHRLCKNSPRKGLPEALRLLITLRYLATGDSYQSLSLSFRIGKSTVQTIIPEVCNVLWEILQPIYIPTMSSEDWRESSEKFDHFWNLPHCVGAIDGKHIHIQAPKKSGSQFFNYKKTFSIVLLGVADAHYKFSYVDIGAFGSQSDGGVLTNSRLGKLLQTGQMNFPIPDALQGEIYNLPYFLVGDEAFPLKEYLITPYSGKYLEEDKFKFNKRLSRARRVVENAFGILVARWNVFKRSIIAQPNVVDSIVKATVVLHNMLCESSEGNYAPASFVDRGNEENGAWRSEAASSNLTSIPSSMRLGARNAASSGIEVRNYLKTILNR